MGDRISIQFRDEDEELSPVLFSHWDGKKLLDDVWIYYAALYKIHVTEGDHTPLSRMEAGTVMYDFCGYLQHLKGRTASNYYLGIDENDGDNSDNGHHIFDLSLGKWIACGGRVCDECEIGGCDHGIEVR